MRLIHTVKVEKLLFDPKDLRALAQNMALLIVEDDPEFCQTLEAIFGKYFGSVTTARDGYSGLVKYRGAGAGGFSVVVTDFSMPGMDGLELIKVIQQERPDQKFLLITAHADLAEIQQMFQEKKDHLYIIPKQVIGEHPRDEDGWLWNRVFSTVLEADSAKFLSWGDGHGHGCDV